jgi:hypothetical protein
MLKKQFLKASEKLLVDDGDSGLVAALFFPAVEGAHAIEGVVRSCAC